MKAAVFEAVGEPLRIENIPEPEPQPTDLILAVKACGICGSDLHMSQVCDRTGGARPLPRGTVMGHEFAGEVVEVGSAVKGDWSVGERVAALPFIGCGRCAACLTGHGRRCAEVIYSGLGQLHGAYADYVRVGAGESLRLPDDVSYREGAMVEPLAVGLHAVRAAKLQPGDSVLVVGAGPVGLSVALWCRMFGARHVIVSDLADGRVQMAAKVGATDGIDASREDVIGRAKQIAGGRPPVVFDCVGVPGSQQICMDYAPADGRVVVVGVCMQPDRTLPIKAITKELQVNYVFMYEKADFELTIEMLARRRADPLAMLTGTVGFDAFPAAFEGLRTPGDQCKVMLEPD